MLTTKSLHHPSFFNKGMVVNKGLMNAVTGGSTKAQDLEILYEKKAQMVRDMQKR